MVKGNAKLNELRYYWENGNVMAETGRWKCPKGNKSKSHASQVSKTVFLEN